MVISTMAPATASACEASTQIVSRTAGTWSSLSGPIVNAAVDASGVSWTVGPDVTLDHVQLEYAATTTGGATVSSAVVLPGSDTGVMPVEGDGDVIVRFVGTSCDTLRSDDVVMDLSAAAGPSLSDTSSTTDVSNVAAPTPTPAPAPQAVARVLTVRHLCLVGLFAY